jgi:hypothetical protein
MFERGVPARRELREVLVEVGGNSAEDRFVPRLLFFAQLADQLLKISAGRGDVLQLGAQRLEAFLELAALAVGQSVGRADLFEAAFQPTHLALACLATGHLLGRNAIRHSRADLFHSDLKQLGFTRA